MASAKALVIQSGITKQIPSGDTLIVGTAIDKATAGVLAIAPVGSVATSIELGAVGINTTVKGDLQVDGAETVTGISTFNNNAIFNGNVTFGDASTDQISFVGRVIGNVRFLKETNHILEVDASTTAATSGGALTVSSGDGATSGGGGNAFYEAGDGGSSGDGGNAYLRSGAGGATGNGGNTFVYGGGATSGIGGAVGILGGDSAAGAGGPVNVVGGAGVGAAGGSVTFDGGTGTTKGAIELGTNNVSAILLGNGTDNPDVTFQGTGTVRLGAGFEEFANGVAAAVSPAGEGRIRYNNTTSTFQVSVSGGAYTDLAVGGAEALKATLVAGQFTGSTATSGDGLDIVFSGDGVQQDGIKIGGVAGTAFNLNFSSAATGVGAALAITGQTGAAASVGGSVQSLGGTGGAGASGGFSRIRGGAAGTEAIGGSAGVFGGIGGATAGAAAGGAGGGATMLPGTGGAGSVAFVGGDGGPANIFGGTGGAGAGALAAGAGGPVNITGGTPGAGGLGAAGGSINLTGADAVGAGGNDGGSVVLESGALSGAGIDGRIDLNVTSGRLTRVGGDLMLANLATPPVSGAAGYGQVYVKTSDGNLYYRQTSAGGGLEYQLTPSAVPGAESLKDTLVAGKFTGTTATSGDGLDIVFSGNGVQQDGIKIGGVAGTAFNVNFAAAATSSPGDISITGQAAGGTNDGGRLFVTGGASSGAGSVGGEARLRGGLGVGTGSVGGEVRLQSGEGDGSTNAGNIGFWLGDSRVASFLATARGELSWHQSTTPLLDQVVAAGTVGADFTVRAQQSDLTKGGDLVLVGGVGTAAADGGNILLDAGDATGAGIDGSISLGTGGTTTQLNVGVDLHFTNVNDRQMLIDQSPSDSAGWSLSIYGGQSGDSVTAQRDGGTVSLAGGAGGNASSGIVGGEGGWALVEGGTAGTAGGSGTDIAGLGGTARLKGGEGGAASVAGDTTGAGGPAIVQGGTAGFNGGPATEGIAGDVVIDGGSAVSVANRGSVNIGTSIAKEINLGNATDNTPVSIVGTGGLSMQTDGFVLMDERAAAPATGGTVGAIYTKDTAGLTQLWYADDAGTEYQITPTAGAPSLASVLAVGNTTGAFDISFDAGQSILIQDNATGVFRVREASNNYLSFTTTNGAEKIDVGNASQNTKVNFLGTGAVSLTGANQELSLIGSGVSGGGAVITMMESSDPTTLADTGALYTKNAGGQTNLFFRSESAGAIYQLTPGTGSSSGKVVIAVNTTTNTMVSGEASYLSASGVVNRTDATAAASSRFSGFYQGTSGEVQVAGVADVTGHITGTLTVGAPVYLDTATTGNVTDTAPVTAGQFVAEVGLAVTTTSVLIQPKSVIAL